MGEQLAIQPVGEEPFAPPSRSVAYRLAGGRLAMAPGGMVGAVPADWAETQARPARAPALALVRALALGRVGFPPGVPPGVPPARPVAAPLRLAARFWPSLWDRAAQSTVPRAAQSAVEAGLRAGQSASAPVPRISSADSSTISANKSMTTIDAPSRAMASAADRPNPRAPPVTSAVLPDNFMLNLRLMHSTTWATFQNTGEQLRESCTGC